MKRNQSDWVQNPTRKQLVLVFSVWLVGIFLIILSTTNLFTESLLQKKYFWFGILVVMSSITLLLVARNYFRNHHVDKVK
ncbi:MAG: hypothetical protein ABJA32_01040 [Ginsengibacter sp.]